MMGQPSDKPIARCVGEFFGHILKGVRQEVAPSRVVRREVQEERRKTADQEVTLRRTIVEEIVVKDRVKEHGA